ncbi:hypothetical protein KP509_24G077700 [Ceratopteris richardii]|uniref:EF-hand domain-containing protein n=1 Tax=Ceratopteris richardii TaxID=49495 RepID=A0A8T2RWL5_CERRI|nr:hypothetical protein KP509_24G077700 [Ceratopteris richardii]KAH7300748.1 hypothetical protein KP509_24G077700 [Ceratopteris richardii]KAH7300749.1 hypothetical protein KP509_24G077700 [Ceratopteris richardii]KAH7300750.1 hypothetical protein KP509_24G077700 [Ceratopteris richardii]
MGVETHNFFPERGKAESCFKDGTFSALMSSLHSAKELIIPMVSSYTGRNFTESNSKTFSSNDNIVISSVSVTDTGHTHLDCLKDFKQASQKGLSLCQRLHSHSDMSQGKLSESCQSYLSNVQMQNELVHLGIRDNIPEVKNLSLEQQNKFPDLSMQGLSSTVHKPRLILKQNHGIHKASDPVPLDAYVSERPLIGTSLFQTVFDRCVSASSVFSKQAGQILPLNTDLLCAVNDSKDKVLGFIHENFCISVTFHDCNQIGNLLQNQSMDKQAGFLKCVRSASLGFARVAGDIKAAAPTVNTDRSPTNIRQSDSTASEMEDPSSTNTAGIFRVPMPTIDRLRSTLSTVSLAELIELVPQLGKASQDFPDKKKLFSVQDFFRYTESEGRRFFEELDRDNDGQVTLEDLEVAMRKRRLPQKYAREFLHRTRKSWLAKSFGWSEFLSLMEQKEPMMLRAYNSLSLSKSGTLQKSQVLASLRNAGLPATEENVAAMMRCLDPDLKGSVAYGQFRNFLLLLPPERLEDDPRMVWFETATVVPMAPPVAVPAESVLKSALAGGLACALSTSLMHPLDTMKTRVQASSGLSFPELISNLPEIGVRGLYRGSIPAILGQFSSHGLRTGIFEASKLLLTNLAPGLAELQVQSMASFCSTVLGTAVRIPCEVLKQRLQAGIFDSVGDALVGTWKQDGPRGFFRGTGATLFREVPFYVAGMGIYAETKKAMRRVLNRELEPWETIAVGALSGGLAAVCTTPFDVMKTRTMTAPPGLSTKMGDIAWTIVREEGLLGLFKGAVPRFFWIAPLGAMNFAGYELAKRAMDKKEQD